MIGIAFVARNSRQMVRPSFPGNITSRIMRSNSGGLKNLPHLLFLTRSHNLVAPTGQKRGEQIANFPVVINDQ